MAISGRVSGILGTENCSAAASGAVCHTPIVWFCPDWHGVDAQAHTTEGDLRDEGFNSGCPLESHGEPPRFRFNRSEGTPVPSFLSSPGDSSGQ